MKADTQNYDANIAKARRQLDQFKRDNLSLGGAMKQTTTQLMGMATRFASVAAAIGAATKVAKDFFNSNEASVDEWGRTIESAKGIYEGFLTSLNTGDFGGFLSRINEIVDAARKAYDELDRLGTMKTIQSPAMSRQMTENERNRMMIQTRRYIAPLNGEGVIPGMKNGQLLTDAQIKTIEADLQNGIERIIQLVTNEVNQTTNSIEAVYNTQAQKLGISIEDFKKGTSSMEEFDRMLDLAKKYDEYEKAHTYTPEATYPGASVKPVRDQTVNPYAQYKDWDVFRVDGEQFQKLVALIQQRDQQTSQVYSSQMQAYRAINRAEGISVRGGGAGTEAATTLTYADDSIKAQEAKVAELTKLWKEASAELRDGYYAQLQKAKSELEEMTKGPLTELKGQMSFAVEPVKIKVDTSNLKLAKNDAQGMRDAFSAAASAVSTVGSALQQIEDPAAKVAGIVAQAIAQIALTFAMSLKGTVTPWDWIAAAAAGTATMISTITAIKAVTSSQGYAEGGMVGGNSYSGDNIVARLNSGEGVLTAQQRRGCAHG